MIYRVEFTAAAARQIRKLPHQIQQRVRAATSTLAKEPRPRGAEVLQGHKGRLRIRVGQYRVIYTVEEDALVVLVLTVGHRREVYRKY